MYDDRTRYSFKNQLNCHGSAEMSSSTVTSSLSAKVFSISPSSFLGTRVASGPDWHHEELVSLRKKTALWKTIFCSSQIEKLLQSQWRTSFFPPHRTEALLTDTAYFDHVTQINLGNPCHHWTKVPRYWLILGTHKSGFHLGYTQMEYAEMHERVIPVGTSTALVTIAYFAFRTFHWECPGREPNADARVK